MLLKDCEGKEFDLTEIGRGCLISARHKTWKEAQPGIVTDVTECQIRVQYPPTVQNVMNHYFILADEAARGDWDIRYSNDGLITTCVFP